MRFINKHNEVCILVNAVCACLALFRVRDKVNRFNLRKLKERITFLC